MPARKVLPRGTSLTPRSPAEQGAGSRRILDDERPPGIEESEHVDNPGANPTVTPESDERDEPAP